MTDTIFECQKLLKERRTCINKVREIENIIEELSKKYRLNVDYDNDKVRDIYRSVSDGGRCGYCKFWHIQDSTLDGGRKREIRIEKGLESGVEREEGKHIPRRCSKMSRYTLPHFSCNHFETLKVE